MKSRSALTPRNKRTSSRKQLKQQLLLDVTVRSRAANKHRNRAILGWLSGVFLLCVAVAGLLYGGREALRRFVWQNPDYYLKEINFHTDGSLTRDQAIQATNIREGKNIFFISLSAARKNLMTLPQVAYADVERILPSTISIDITERKPVAWVTGADDDNPSADPGAFLIDREGILMRIKNPARENFHLPVICGLDVGNYEEGGTVDLPEVRAALELIRITGQNPSRYQVRSIDVSKGYCLVVSDERHAQITFPLEGIAAQLDRLALLYANVDSNRREIQTVNLLVQRNVPVTFAPSPDEAADPDAPAALAAPSPSAAQPSPVKKVPLASTKKITVKKAQAVRKPTPYVYHEVRRAIPVFPVSSPNPQP